MAIKNPINKAHQNLFNEFGTVSHAARKLEINRVTIMTVLNGGGSDRIRSLIRRKGYDPDTFLPL